MEDATKNNIMHYSLAGQTLFYLCVVTGAHNSIQQLDMEEAKKKCFLHVCCTLLWAPVITHK